MGVRPRALDAILASRDGGAALHEDAFVDEWIQRRRAETGISSALVPLSQMEGWQRERGTGNLRHAAGRFFSVTGVHCRHRLDRTEIEWDQPIIEQPETGILGILAKVIDGVMHFCLHAKEEPGNIGGVQLSPTVQATYSNYTGAHGGAAPPFLELFTAPAPGTVLIARLQTEDGGRFLYKSNRNLIVDAGDDFPVELPDGFIWLTLRQLAGLLRKEDIVNACARSVLSCLVFAPGAALPVERTALPEGLWDTLQWLDDRRAATHMQARRIGLDELKEWHTDAKGFFSHRERHFFRVVGMRVTAAAREVTSWCQPIIENAQPGVIGLLVREGPRGLELLMQARAEVGNKTAVQLAPTVQFTPGNYAVPGSRQRPLLFETFLGAAGYRVVHESRQAEEGARFFREHHVHRILALPAGADLLLTADYRWLPLSHVQFLVHLGEQVNSCARSVLACLV
jgi:oxidase EvaA